MSEQFPSSNEVPRPTNHELRVAVFSLSQRALAGSFHLPLLVGPATSPGLFKDIHPLNKAGLTGVSHEDRATSLFRAKYCPSEMPYLKIIAPLGSVLVTEEDGITHTVNGIAVQTATPYDFKHDDFRAYDMRELESQAHTEVTHPGSTPLDTIDAQFISEAVRVIGAGRPLRRQ